GDDPTLPTSEDRDLAVTTPASRGAMTLREAVSDSFSGNATPSRAAPAVVQVDDAVAEKPVMVFGSGNTSRERLPQSLAALYGLRLFVRKDRSTLLTLPAPHTLRTVTELPAEIRRLTPAPLLRSFDAQVDQAASQQAGKHGPPVPQTGMNSPYRFQAESAYYFPATRRLRALVELKLPTRQSQPVPVSAFGSEASRLIALRMLSAGGLQAINGLISVKPPQCLTDPGTVCIGGRPDKDGTVRGVTIGYRNEEGAYRPEVGASISGASGG
ncbi:MAG: hypothetical protein H7Z41_09360, partial [Cytophagales bacterium]|nr:hypothetical protein [Armatimonadota bacterium]